MGEKRKGAPEPCVIERAEPNRYTDGNLFCVFAFCCKCPRHKAQHVGVVQELHMRPTKVLDIKGVKPIQALDILAKTLREGKVSKEEWLLEAKAAAILGSCPRSMSSLQSGRSAASCTWYEGCAVCCVRHQALAALRWHHAWHEKSRAKGFPAENGRYTRMVMHLPVGSIHVDINSFAFNHVGPGALAHSPII